MPSRLERLYPRLPIPLQNLACHLYGWQEARVRFGPAFQRKLDELEQSERWTSSDIEGYQDEQVRGLIAHAYQHVPYYRRTMTALGLTPGDIRGVGDLPKLPLLRKEDARSHFPELVADNASRSSLIHRHTSGTTGKSLEFYSTAESIAFQWAVWWRHRHRFGLDRQCRHANFTGKLVVPPDQGKPPYWRHNAPMHQVLFNMHHIVPSKIDDIVRYLNREAFVYYSGYPSIIHALCAIGAQAGLALTSRPRYVVTGAEKLLDFQRRDIEAFTGARLTDQYGQSEGCANASQCERGAYHEDFEFCVIEQGSPESLPDGRVRGRLVCTGFANTGFPFIRYDVGDVGVWDPAPCPCGRASRVLADIEGRAEDYVLTPEGRMLMRFDYVFKDTPNISECQVVQERLGEIVLRVVRRPGYSAHDERKVRDEIARWISSQLEVRFEYVPEIEREPGGKFRAVKSKLGATSPPPGG